MCVYIHMYVCMYVPNPSTNPSFFLFLSPLPFLFPLSFPSMRLRDLQDQEQKDVVKFLKLREASGELKLSQSGLYLTIHFQYSKVAPIRAKIYTVQVGDITKLSFILFILFRMDYFVYGCVGLSI